MLSQKKSNSKRQVLPRLAEQLAIGVIAGATFGIFLPVFSTASAQSVQVIGDDASTPRLFSIPAQRLSIALAQFGRQSGLQVVFPANVPQGMNSSAVSGMMTAQQALSLLLQGTGIDWYISRQGAIVGTEQTLDGAQGSDFSGDTSLLDTIIVADPNNQNAISGSGFQGTPDWVYASPSAVSVISRETIKNAPVRETRDLLDNVAGVYANRSEAQNPGITVSVRGLQDQNRVVTMVDGARQNFQRNGHGSTQRTYVDTAFLREIDIEKSGTSGVGGAGALGGSVNFRSLNASDLIKPGREWGFEGTVATGTNAFEFDGSGTVAVRVSDAFSILAGISHKKIGEYNIGKNGDLKVPELTVDDNAVVSTGSEVFSTFLKAEAQFSDDLKGSLAWMRNDSEFTHGGYSTGRETFTENSQHVVNNTITATLDWNPDSDLVDLKARLWYNHLKNAEVRGATVTNNYTDWPVDYSLGTLGASLDNTSEFVTPFGALSLNYGAEAFWDRGSTDSDTFYSTNEGTHDFTASYTGMTPSGNRDVYSAFANATLDHGDWLTLSGGLRYDYYKLHGNASIYGYERTGPVQTTCAIYHPAVPTLCIKWNYSEATRSYPETVLDIDQSEGALLPSAMIAVKPFDWLQPFVKYSRSMRPPSIMETFFTGGHPGVNITQNAPNPDLKAESGDTFEIGANISHNGLFTDRDSFRFKAVGFYRLIDDYISLGEVYRPETGRDHTAFVNVDGQTQMKGIEIEASYDARLWYAGLSYTHLNTDFGDSYTYSGTSYDVEPSVIFVPPTDKFTLDAGMRLFDEKLTLGGKISHVGGTSPNIGLLVASYETEDYTLYDLYGSYKFTENVTLRAAVNNVTDVAYVPALGASSYPGPGRTATVSLNFSF